MTLEIVALGIVQKALLASAVLGLMCGVLGSLVVMRRISLVGDAISHSVLPGVVLGFLISGYTTGERNPWIIFTCAVIIGLLSIAVVRQIVSTTRLKPDAALGIVLSGFFGIGLFLKRSLLPYMKSAGGLDSFLFGNMATISDADLHAVLIVGLVLAITIPLLLRPFILLSFDPLFAETLGYPIKLLNLIFYTLLTVTIVASLQAVGVILVSSMLIIPAASAHLLTEQKKHMMWVSMLLGALSGVIGSLLSSSIEANIANGAVITVVAATIFFICYLAAPQHGIIASWLKRRRLQASIAVENSLKAIYKLVENSEDLLKPVSVTSYTELRRLSNQEAHKTLIKLEKAGAATLNKDTATLTQSGLIRAQQIVRNHRLWELYLTKQADYQADHVHDDAELIEHLLDEETVKQLEAELNFPETDPHGKPIPKPNTQEGSLT